MLTETQTYTHKFIIIISNLYLKTIFGTRDVEQMIEFIPCMHKALGSLPSTPARCGGAGLYSHTREVEVGGQNFEVILYYMGSLSPVRTT